MTTPNKIRAFSSILLTPNKDDETQLYEIKIEPCPT
jgi:hypothetical protein